MVKIVKFGLVWSGKDEIHNHDLFLFSESVFSDSVLVSQFREELIGPKLVGSKANSRLADLPSFQALVKYDSSFVLIGLVWFGLV